MKVQLVLAAASLASAAVMPKAAHAPMIPTHAFPKFHTISLDDAKQLNDIAGLDFGEMKGDKDKPKESAMRLSSISTFSAAAAPCTNPSVRVEWRKMSSSDRTKFVNSVKCLMGKPASGKFNPAKNRYEDFVRLHQMYMPNIHGNQKFLVWHRYFLWAFEQELRDVCGLTSAFPWWDETLDAGNFRGSPLFTSSYFGTLSTSAQCVSNGAFAGITLNIGPGTSNQPHCLSRQVDEDLTAQCNTNFVNACNSRTDYASMHSCSELGPHAYGHNGIGSVMSDVSSSPSDPVFWMHHAFVDHSFRIWQNVDVSRRTSINGHDVNGNPLTLDTKIYLQGIRPDVTIRDILDTMGGATIGSKTFCYKYDY